jgi:uncharacterized protein YegJ (DUF2314 family)
MTLRYVLMLVALPLFFGCQSEDQEFGQTVERDDLPMIAYVDDDSPEMIAAIEKARSTVAQFTIALANPKAAQSSFAVKLAVVDNENVEHIWIMPVRHHNAQFVGKINNEPERVTTVKSGDEVTVAEDKITDWMYVDNGRLVGGFTLRVLRSKMTEDDGYEFDRSVPFVIADDLDADEPWVRFFDSIGNVEHDLLKSLLTAHPEFANRVGNVAVESPLGDMELEAQHPLKYAVYHGNTRAVEILLQHEADSNPRDEYGATPLHDAAMRNHADIILLLAKNGADVNATNEIGLTPLKSAAGNDNTSCAKTLLELGADVDVRLTVNKQNLLHNIHSPDMAKILLDAGADLEAIDDDGETPLHVATINGFADLVVYLIERGANTDTKNKDGQTPLDIARESLEDADYSRVLAAMQSRP